MKTIVFDTETTGLNPGSICQLSYLIVDEKNITGKNFFFSVDYIEPGAAIVNKLSVEKLDMLSHGKTFSDYADEIYRDFDESGLLIAHNFDFDINFLNHEFRKAGHMYRYKKYFCTMKGLKGICRLPSKNGRYGYKMPSLQELTRFFDINEGDIVSNTAKYFGSGTSGFHDARYDATAAYMCFHEAFLKRCI